MSLLGGPPSAIANHKLYITMNHKILKLFLPVCSLLFAGLAAEARNEKAATLVEDAIWANDAIYSTVLTTNSFRNPPRHSVDILYNFNMSGLTGQRSVSDAAPGDDWYNGGRWWVHMVVFTDAGKAVHDPDGDGEVNFELTNAGAVLHHAENLGHLEIHETEMFFSCPLVKSAE